MHSNNISWGEVTFVWSEVTSITERTDFWLGRSDWGRNDHRVKWPGYLPGKIGVIVSRTLS